MCTLISVIKCIEQKEILVYINDHNSGTGECKMTTINITIPT